MAVAYQPHRFTRDQFYVIAPSLDPQLRYELLDGTIYAMSPANPPHAGIVTYLNHRFRGLDPAKYLVRLGDTLEIEPDGAPQPDLAIVDFRADFYGGDHPSGADAALVIEVGDSKRKPHEKMSDYMRDGRIPVAWRIDVQSRFVEVWDRRNLGLPIAVRRGSQKFSFNNVTFSVDEVFSTVLNSRAR